MNKTLPYLVANVIEILDVDPEELGYEEDGGFWVLKEWDIKELQAITGILQRYAGYYN